MTNYVDLVLVIFTSDVNDKRSKRYLFEAPGFAHIQDGSKVICNVKDGTETGWVVSSYTVDKNSEEYNFMCECTSATLPLKRIKSKIREIELDYEDEEEKEEVEVAP